MAVIIRAVISIESWNNRFCSSIRSEGTSMVNEDAKEGGMPIECDK